MAKKINKKNLLPMYRVVSDGTAWGTYIYDTTGKKVGRVTKVTWEMSIDDPVGKMHLEVNGVEIDATGKPSITRRIDKTIN